MEMDSEKDGAYEALNVPIQVRKSIRCLRIILAVLTVLTILSAIISTVTLSSKFSAEKKWVVKDDSRQSEEWKGALEKFNQTFLSQHQKLNKTIKELREELKATSIQLNATKEKLNSQNRDEPPPGSCPDTYFLNPFSNTCYGLIKLGKSWQQAKDYCEANNGYLATFETLESASWFLNLRKTSPVWFVSMAWIGGRKDTNNTWRWYGRVTGPLVYSLWGPGEPNRVGPSECLRSYMNPVDDTFFEFDDYLCNYKFQFFCEKEL